MALEIPARRAEPNPIIPHAAEVRRDVSNRDIRDMIDWAKDDNRPGCFTHYFDNRRNVMVVAFTDENAAFQFKVRWG